VRLEIGALVFGGAQLERRQIGVDDLVVEPAAVGEARRVAAVHLDVLHHGNNLVVVGVDESVDDHPLVVGQHTPGARLGAGRRGGERALVRVDATAQHLVLHRLERELRLARIAHIIHHAHLLGDVGARGSVALVERGGGCTARCAAAPSAWATKTARRDR
jgi:hypothetical protein